MRVQVPPATTSSSGDDDADGPLSSSSEPEDFGADVDQLAPLSH